MDEEPKIESKWTSFLIELTIFTTFGRDGKGHCQAKIEFSYWTKFVKKKKKPKKLYIYIYIYITHTHGIIY